jgi:hypothetical protein
MPTPERQSELIGQAAELVRQLSAVMSELHGQSRTLLDQYIDASLHRRDGFKMAFSELYAAFKAWLPERERENWSKGRVLQELAFPTADEGRSDQPRKMVQGLSWHPAPPKPEPVKPEPVKPKNPDYDHQKMLALIKSLFSESVKSFDQVALKMNELGHRDKYGNPWEKKTVADVHFDYDY